VGVGSPRVDVGEGVTGLEALAVGVGGTGVTVAVLDGVAVAGPSVDVAGGMAVAPALAGLDMLSPFSTGF
jgi:hypothetical protein